MMKLFARLMPRFRKVSGSQSSDCQKRVSTIDCEELSDRVEALEKERKKLENQVLELKCDADLYETIIGEARERCCALINVSEYLLPLCRDNANFNSREAYGMVQPALDPRNGFLYRAARRVLNEQREHRFFPEEDEIGMYSDLELLEISHFPNDMVDGQKKYDDYRGQLYNEVLVLLLDSNHKRNWLPNGTCIGEGQ